MTPSSLRLSPLAQPTSRTLKQCLAACVVGYLALTLLAGCSRPSSPPAGTYRASLELKGGELPLTLHIGPTTDPSRGAIGVELLQDGQPLPASDVAVKDGHLSATWAALGTLSAKFDQSQLQGQWRFADPKGQPVVMPFAATVGQSWRFVEQSSTDNIDITGAWQLEALSTEHFNVPLALQLKQQHDQVDGQLTLPDGATVHVTGQTHGDEVYLSTLGQGRAVLLKGKVSDKGDLKGEFWVNMSTAHPWVARRVTESAPTEAALSTPADAGLEDTGTARQVGLPWAVPTRPFTQTD